MEQTDSFQRGGRRGYRVKEGKGISQRTYRYNPQTWVMVMVNKEGVWGPDGGGNEGICNSVNNKIKVKKIIPSQLKS